jgi:hypothetical protein
MLRARELRERTVGSIPLDMVPGYSGVFLPGKAPAGLERSKLLKLLDLVVEFGNGMFGDTTRRVHGMTRGNLSLDVYCAF